MFDDLGLTSCERLKIEAENAEYEVVKGGMGMIQRLRPAVVLDRRFR